MKQIIEFINEKLIINKNIKINKYNYFPKNRRELIDIIVKKYQDLDDKNEILDLNDIDISKVTDLSHVFELVYPKKVNMNNWNTSNVTDIHGLFWQNKTIEEIHIDDWDVSKVKNATGAFYRCSNLTKLDLKNWDLKNCIEFDLMFKGCEQLDTKFTDYWNITQKITCVSMFEGCKYKPKWYKEI